MYYAAQAMPHYSPCSTELDCPEHLQWALARVEEVLAASRVYQDAHVRMLGARQRRLARRRAQAQSPHR